MTLPEDQGSNNTNINTEGGTFVGKDVNTGRDFIGRDLIQIFVNYLGNSQSKGVIIGAFIVATASILAAVIPIISDYVGIFNPSPANTDGLFSIPVTSAIIPFPTAQPDEYLIVMSEFLSTENSKEYFDSLVQVAEPLQELVDEASLNHEVIIRKLSDHQIQDEEDAQYLGKTVNASIVIWGRAAQTSIEVNFSIFHDKDSKAIDLATKRYFAEPDASPAHLFLLNTASEFRESVKFITVFTLAQYYYSQARFEETLDLLQNNLKNANIDTKEFASIYLLQGNTYLQIGDLPHAVESYEKILDLDSSINQISKPMIPMVIRALYNRAIVRFYYEFDTTSSLADLDNLLKLDKQYSNGLILRAAINANRATSPNLESSSRSNLLEQALADLDLALESLPAEQMEYAFDIFANRGNIYARLGDPQNAELDYLRITGEDFDCHPVFSLKSENSTSASRDWCAQASSNLAEFYMGEGTNSLEKVISLTKLAQAVTDNEFIKLSATVTLGKAYLQMNKIDLACATLQDAQNEQSMYPGLSEIITSECKN